MGFNISSCELLTMKSNNLIAISFKRLVRTRFQHTRKLLSDKGNTRLLWVNKTSFVVTATLFTFTELGESDGNQYYKKKNFSWRRDITHSCPAGLCYSTYCNCLYERVKDDHVDDGGGDEPSVCVIAREL